MIGWYRTGTVSINNNSNQLVGVGTAWLDAGVAIGEGVQIPGVAGMLEVLSIESNTRITLAAPYTGANVAASSYSIIPTQSYERALAETARALIAAIGDMRLLAGKGMFAPGVEDQPSLRGTADRNTGINLPGDDTLEILLGGLLGLKFAADGTPSGPAATKMPVSTAQAAAFSMWRGDVRLDQDFHALQPGMYRYTPGVDGNVHANAPPVEYGYGYVFVHPGAPNLASYIKVVPDPPYYRLWATSRFGTNTWRPWHQDGAQTQLDNLWDASQTFNAGIKLPAEGRAVFGPNTTYGQSLLIGGTASTSPTSGSIAVSDGNLHIDAARTGASAGVNYATYINFYRGQGGTKFCNGQNTVTAEVTPGGHFFGGLLAPKIDNTHAVGGATARYTTIYLGSNPVVTSDARLKLDVKPSLGLNLVLGLRSVCYRIADAKVSMETIDDGYEDVLEPVYEDRPVETEQIVIEAGRPVRKRVSSVESVPVVDMVPVVDEDGTPVLDAHGKPLLHPVPRMQTVRKPKTREKLVVREGVRWHHGLLAQEVLALLEGMGLSGTDFAGLIYDPETDTWGLRYEQFVAPIVRAIQQLYELMLAQRAEDANALQQVITRIQALEARNA